MTDEPQAGWNDGLKFLMNQCTKDSKEWFPESQSLAFMVLAMAGEVGEVANIVKKIERGSTRIEDVRGDLAEEVVDVLIYLLNLMGLEEFKDVDWMDIWYKKRTFNRERFGTLDPCIVDEYNPYVDSERPY